MIVVVVVRRQFFANLMMKIDVSLLGWDWTCMAQGVRAFDAAGVERALGAHGASELALDGHALADGVGHAGEAYCC